MNISLENPPRIDKTIEWLNQSRDQWKEKCLLAKTRLKRQTLATKRLREGRNALKTELKSMQKQLEVLEKKINLLEERLLDYKKKP